MLEPTIIDLDLLKQRLATANAATATPRPLQKSSRENTGAVAPKTLKNDASTVISLCLGPHHLYNLDQLCASAAEAFAYSYGGDFPGTVRKHLQFAVKLISAKAWHQCLGQLCVVKAAIAAALSQASPQSSCEHAELLRPVHFVDTDAQTANIVVAYHFLVLQCLLQVMAASGTTLREDTHPFVNVGLLGAVAQMLLHSSDFSRWLEFCYTFSGESRRKHTANVAKIVQGCVKLCDKLVGDFAGLHDVKTSFCLKQIEYQYKLDGAANEDAIGGLTLGADHHEFAADLVAAVPALAPVLQRSARPVSSDDLVALIQSGSIGPLRAALAAGSYAANARVLRACVSAKNGSTDFYVCILSHIDAHRSALRSLTKDHLGLLDAAAMHAKAGLESGDSGIVPIISAIRNIIGAFNQPKRLRNCSNLLYNLGCKTKDPELLKTAVEYELQIYLHEPTADNRLVLDTKLEKTLVFLAARGAVKQSSSLIGAYFEHVVSAPTTELSYYEVRDLFPYPHMARAIIGCTIQDTGFIDTLVAPASSQLQAAIFIAISTQLEFFEAAQKSQVVELLIHKFQVSDSTLQLLCLLHYYKIAGLTSYQELPSSYLEATEPSSALLVSGILLHRNINVDWHEENLKESIRYLELYLSQCAVINCYEEEIVNDLIYYLVHIGFYGYVNYVLHVYSKYRNLTDYPELTNQVYKMTLVHTESLNNFGMSDMVLSKLEQSSGLIRQLAKNLKPKDVVAWKLLQVEYFLSIDDIDTATEKFSSIITFLKSKPEFDLGSQVSCSLETKLSNLLLVSKVHLVAYEFNRRINNLADGYQNCKMAIKILVSMFKKIATEDLNVSNRQILWSAHEFLVKAHINAIDTLKCLGISRDLEFYLQELRKLNNTSKRGTASLHSGLSLFKTYSLLDFKQDANEELTRISQLANSVSNDKNARFLHNLAVFIDKKDHSILEIPEPAFTFQELKSLQFQSVLPYSELTNESIYIASCLNPSSPLGIQTLADDLYGAVYQIRQQFREALKQTESDSLFHDIRQSVISSPSFSSTRGAQGKLIPIWHELARSISDLLGVETGMPSLLKSNLLEMLSLCSSICQTNDPQDIRSMFYMEELVRSEPFTNEQILKDLSINSTGILPGKICKTPVSSDMDGFFEDLERFVPDNWMLVTIDVCCETGDLMLSKYAHKNVLKLRLPVSRMSTRDKTVSGLSFNQASEELSDIIHQSDQSIKPKVTSTIKTKEDRKNWWKLRFSLDLRIQELLERVENEWLGAFAGVFDFCSDSSSFTRSVSILIDKYFPSRKNPKRLQFDPKTLELFSQTTNDKDPTVIRRKLDDILYFLVDTLTYSGEANAYDEINAESFYEELSELIESHRQPKDSHIVLITSSKCASIPWESLSCLTERSVSRMPSIHMLLDRLKNSDNLEVSAKNSFYMVNPGGDLIRTEAKFKPLFQNQQHWSGIIGNHTTDSSRLLSDMVQSDLFIYLGHGGCEQYLKASALFKQSSALPPSLLIGCSSGALQSYGILGASGNVYNWLVCGSPMVLVNLWDVTDKDIDQFSLSVFEESGIFNGEGVNICEAVRQARSSCTLKYLNGSAPVVYGLPLKLTNT